jgi:hypothetical protein
MGRKSRKVKKICFECNKQFEVSPNRSSRARFCSNKCKWERNKHFKNPNKTPIEKLFKAKCANQFCNNIIMLQPWQVKKRNQKGIYKYCSKRCFHYCKSDQYQKDLIELQRKKQEQQKQYIWFLR